MLPSSSAAQVTTSSSSSSSASSDAIAAAACAALESGALQLANHPTVALYFVRDHVRSSLPPALATARLLEGEALDALRLASHDAAAASEAVELLRGAAPGAIERMSAALDSASASLVSIEEGGGKGGGGNGGGGGGGGGKKGSDGGGIGGGSPSSSRTPPPRVGTGPGALLSSLYEVATGGIGGGGGSKQRGR